MVLVLLIKSLVIASYLKYPKDAIRAINTGLVNAPAKVELYGWQEQQARKRVDTVMLITCTTEFQ